MRFFGLKSCDTCKKALKSLAERGIVPQVIDVRSDGVSAADRATIAQEFGEAAINRASTTWRALDESTRALPVADLLAAHPTVMKRPVIDGPAGWSIGWKPDVQANVLGSG